MHKILFWLFFAKIKMATCIPEVHKSGFKKSKNLFEIEKVGSLPPQINESSGLLKIHNSANFYTNNDGGGKTELFEIDSSGNLISTIPVPNSKNTDWEDLAQDRLGNIYVGDFGNNQNQRKDLKIYIFDPKNIDKQGEIEFSFADQTQFPPPKNEMNFDCEAMFWANDSLYLFSKNRGQKNVKLYAMPSKPGKYNIMPKETIFLKANITSADINPSQSQFALLSYGKVFLFGVEQNQISFAKPLFCIKTPLRQSEAITYISYQKLLITNEQGEIFTLNLTNPIH